MKPFGLYSFSSPSKLPESERRRGAAVVVQSVILDGVVRALLEERRDVGDYIPIAHETFEVNVIYGIHLGLTSGTGRQ